MGCSIMGRQEWGWMMIQKICEICDGEMVVSNEKGKPMMLLTGDVETGNQRVAKCPHCNNRVILKD